MSTVSHIRGLLGENVIETLYAAHREFLRTRFGATMLPLMRQAFTKPTLAAQDMGFISDHPLLGNRINVQQFFSVRSHEPAWRSLCACLARGEGVVVVTGDAGIGKSQLLLRLRGLLPDSWDMALIEDAGQPQALFTQTLCDAVGADIAGPHEWSMTADEVLDAVANRVEFGRNVLLAIDNAHRLTQENLNIINSILLFAVSQARPVQILLMGRPELSHCLDLPAFQLLRNAMIDSVVLTPLTRVEVWEYIRFQARRVLGKIPRITWPAWLEVYAASHGNPRAIDLLLHRIFFASENRDVRFLTGRMVRRGRTLLDSNYHPQPGRGLIPWLAMTLLVSFVGYLSGTLYFSLFPPTPRVAATHTTVFQGTLPPVIDTAASGVPQQPPPVEETMPVAQKEPPAPQEGTPPAPTTSELSGESAGISVSAHPPLPDSRPLKRKVQQNPPQPSPVAQQKPVQSEGVPPQDVANSPLEGGADGVATESTLKAAGRLFVVQIGSFLSKSNAEQMARGLKQKGMESYVHLYQKEGKNWFSVRINHRDRPAAEQTATLARRETGQSAEVISLMYE